MIITFRFQIFNHFIEFNFLGIQTKSFNVKIKSRIDLRIYTLYPIIFKNIWTCSLLSIREKHFDYVKFIHYRKIKKSKSVANKYR